MRLTVVLATISLASAAQAQAPCPMTYEFFEFAVPHLDLESCPKDLARKGAFCRASVGHDGAHVFVFAEDGDRCLLATKTFQTGQYELAIK